MDDKPIRKYNIDIDDAKLEKILQAIKPAPKGWRSLDDWVKIIQAAALVFTGVWVLLLFVMTGRESAALDNQLKFNAVDAAGQSPLGVDVTLDVDRLSTKETVSQDFLAHLHVGVHNPSQHAIDIPEAEVLTFLGDLKLTGKGTFTTTLNRPLPYELAATNAALGPIVWQCTQTNHYYSLDAAPDDSPLPNGFAVGHPAFGPLLHDEDAGSDTLYRIRANRNQWIGFVVRFKVGTNDSCTNDDWARMEDEFCDLASATNNTFASSKTDEAKK